MTQLERELKQTLRVQEELFKSELQQVTRQYEKSLQGIKTSYDQIIADQQTIIEGQSQTLSEYAQASRNIKIRLDDQQVQTLTEQVQGLKSHLERLDERLNSSEEQDKDLVTQLNGVLAKL